MGRLRLPLRLARREVRRRPGRTCLVALLVALPVAGMAMAITLIRTDAETPQEEWQRTRGESDAVAYSLDAERAGLPEGSRTIAVQSSYARVKAGGLRAGIEVTDLPLDDPMTEGIHELVAGRAPTRPGELVLSTRLADDLDLEVGDEVVWERPALTGTLVGEVEPVGCLSCRTALFAPGELPAAALGVAASPESAFLLIDLPDGRSEQELIDLYTKSEGNLLFRDPPAALAHASGDEQGRGEAVRWSLVIGALVLTVVGIVISAAFAVGARRQLVTIGQLSASGASPGTVRAALVLQGTVTGVVGTLAGLGLAAALLLLGQPVVERVLDQRLHGYDTRGGELVLVAAIGIGAATLAALIPARTAARVPTLAALAGRRPLAPVSHRLITWGVACMIGGLGLLFMAVLGAQSGSSGDLWAFVAIVGGVAELLGACAIAPAVVARLEPLANRLRGALRLGARSLARHRARTGAVVSAVAAAGALAVAAGGLMLGTDARNGVEVGVPDDVVVVQTYDDDGVAMDVGLAPEARASLVEAVPDAREVDITAVGRPGPTEAPFWTVAKPGTVPAEAAVGGQVTWEQALVADDELLDVLRADDRIRDGLEETGVVVLTSNYDGGNALDGDVQVTLPDGRSLPGIAMQHRYTTYLSGILMDEATADDLGLEASSIATVFDNPTALTDAERADIEDVQYEIQDAPRPTGAGFTSLQWSAPDDGPSPFQLELILSGVALLFSLFVVGVSLALAAAESKDERDVLTIAGAPPGLLARMAGARAWLLAVIGAVMAVPVGFLPVVVFAKAQGRSSPGSFTQDFPLVFPTRTVLLLVVAVPVAVSLVSWATSAAAQRLRPLHVSTATFE